MARGPILLFVGPPGVGKTSVAEAIAKAIGREYVRIALGGVRDEADIRGHRRTYVGAMPGRIIQGIKQAGTKNPVFLLDEIDKLGVSFQGDPSAALLEVLDPAQNHTFTRPLPERALRPQRSALHRHRELPQNIPAPLMDRMEIVEFSGYTEKREGRDRQAVTCVPKKLSETGLKDKNIGLRDDALGAVVREYTRESGVRQLLSRDRARGPQARAQRGQR